MRILEKRYYSLKKSVKLVYTSFMEKHCKDRVVKRKFESNSDTKKMHAIDNCDKNKKMKPEDIIAGLVKETNVTELKDTYQLPGNNLANVTFEPIPTKSESDDKEYLSIKLGNGLRVLLISDVKNLLNEESLMNPNTSNRMEGNNIEGESENSITEEGYNSEGDPCESDYLSQSSDSDSVKGESNEKLAACALTVGVGSFSDPENIPGLAHFLEHMVFMGSEKYPNENDFDSYISTRGGSDNASTECEYTSFYFECPEIYLAGALDRFTNFFISPLMNFDSISREREAVESEFKSHLTSDATRLEQLFCSTASSNNPARKFMWGNLITLQQNIADDELHYQLRRFWDRHYSSDRMTVAIQGRLPMDTLLSLAVTYFGNIANNEMPPDEFPDADPPFVMELFNKMYTVQPVKDINKLLITWALPSMIKHYKSKPLTYLSHLIGDEGEGSLLAYLQEKLWALTITVGNGDSGVENNSLYSLFTIDITLTEEGLLNIESVVQSVFCYIKLIRGIGPVESIYEEIKLIEDINFRYADEKDPADYVEDLSQNMQIYPPEQYINGDQLLFEYNPDQIKDVLSNLTPDKVNIIVTSRIAADKVELDKTEPWFGTKYRISDIPLNWYSQWNNCGLNTHFKIPSQNQYIASDFQLLSVPIILPEHPEQIVKDERIETWYKQDTKFKLPIGYIKIYMISPMAGLLPQNTVMCDMLVSLFCLMVSKELYPATVAGLGYKFRVAENGLILSVDGYNEKLPLLLQKLLTEVTTFSKNITSGLFEAVKEETRKTYYNRILKASLLGNELRLSILTRPFWPSTTKLKCLSNVTLEKLQTFSENFFENLYIKCLIQGNIDRNQATTISNSITETIDYMPIGDECVPNTQVRQISSGEKILRVQAFNKTDPNCNITNYYQCGPNTIENYCQMELVMMIIQEPLFDTLRTKEQLGYDVNCETRITNGILGFTVTVHSQANKFQVDHVEKRITKFLIKMKNDLKTMTTTHFNHIKESMTILKQQADNDLKTELERNWSEITSGDYIFDRNKREAKLIPSFTQNNILNFYSQLLGIVTKNKKTAKHNDNTLCLRKLSVQVDSGIESSNSPEKDHRNKARNQEAPTNSKYECKLTIKTASDSKIKDLFIQNVEAYKNSLYIYPAVTKKSKVLDFQL